MIGAGAGEIQVGLLQGGMPGHKFVHGDAMHGGQIADRGRVQPRYGESAITFWPDSRAVGGEQPGEFAGPG